MSEAARADDPLRIELAEFLRQRRAELSPEAVGLPNTSRRRTPGLRREEVAELAGISTALYAWLEQARDVPVSEHTLDAIAKALRLSSDENEHLRHLARPQPTQPLERLSPSVRRMVLAMREQAAYVLDAAWNIVLENERAAAIFGSSNADGAERNFIKRIISGEATGALVDWESSLTFLVERLQFDVAATGGDARVLELAADLRKNELFARAWETRRVRSFGNRLLLFDHPELGDLALETTSFRVFDAPGLRLLVFTPCDAAAVERELREDGAKV